MDAPQSIFRTFVLPLHSEQSDAELLRLCAEGGQGGQRAWGKLVERHYARIYRVPRVLGINSQDAEDVAQETFLELYRAISSLNVQGSIEGWLVAVARKKAMDFFRRQHPTVELDPNLLSTNNLIQSIDEKESLQNAFQSLTSAEQQVITVLLEIPNSTDTEIALALNKNTDTVKKIRQSAMKKLRDTLTKL